MSSVQLISTSNVLVYTTAATLLYLIVRRRSNQTDHQKSTQTTPLRGPPSKSFITGARALDSEPGEEPSAIFNEWIKEYGTVIRVPTAFGGSNITLLDPKAANHFYMGETWLYQRHKLGRKVVEQLFGRGLQWAEANAHRRQRKALTPAFSNSAIRRLTPLFYDSVHKATIAWEQLIEASGSDETVIEVQNWMNRISLDSIGIGGFSHDFNTLTGARSAMLDIFTDIGTPASQQSKIGIFIFLLSFIFPSLLNLPTKYNQVLTSMKTIMKDIADDLLERTRNEKKAEAGGAKAEESLIGLLIKAENEDAELNMSEEEILAQMNSLVFAGYDTTSAAMTWVLVELCRNEEIQRRLREEIMETGPGDATYEQLMNGLPLLDAVVHEVLRLNPPIPETIRVATERDVLPLSKPYTTATGEVVTRIIVKEGETVSVPLRWFNRAEEYWGPDANEFNPDRWLDETREKGSKDINGYRRLLTFSDGARICLGKQFAMLEIKAVITTLLKNYEFRFRDGKDTKIGVHPSLLPRPKIEGEEGMSVPLVVKRIA